MSHVTTRIAGNIGSRYDKVGGEAALLASAMGGNVGREYIAIPGKPLSSPSSSSLPPLDAARMSLVTSADVVKSRVMQDVGTLGYEAQMMDRLHETAYQTSSGGGGNSLGSPLRGTVETIGAVTVSDIECLTRRIRGMDVVVVGTGSGGVHDRLVEDVSKAYGTLPGGGEEKKAGSLVKAEDKSAFIGSDIRIRYDSMNVATVAIAFAGASHMDPKAYPLALMKAILGSYASADGLGKNVASSMCQEVADHELASSISAFNLSYTDAGLFGIVATAPDNKLDDLLWYVMPSMVRLAHGISDEELARAKLVLKSSILSSYDGDVVLGETMAAQFSTVGRIISLAESLARVDALDMADVKSAASEVINDQDHALAAIGGIHELPDYNWIRRHSYMLRY